MPSRRPVIDASTIVLTFVICFVAPLVISAVLSGCAGCDPPALIVWLWFKPFDVANKIARSEDTRNLVFLLLFVGYFLVFSRVIFWIKDQLIRYVSAPSDPPPPRPRDDSPFPL
jgi:hypothetical protein